MTHTAIVVLCIGIALAAPIVAVIVYARREHRSAGYEQCTYCEEWFAAPVCLHHTDDECFALMTQAADERRVT